MTIKKLLISVAIWVLPAINGFASSDDPDRSGGSAEPANYNSFGLDNINIYNGALSVNIPLGSKYPLNGGYSYGFSLYFSPDMWFEDSINCQGNPNFDVEFAEPFQRRRLLAGFGWALTPGPELLSGPSGSYDFITSDGASHRFEFDQPGDTVAITTDGTYFRLRVQASTFEVDYPNGNVAVFDRSSGRLSSVHNAYDEVLLSYQYGPNGITITDSADRTHTIIITGSIVSELRLAAFGNTEAVYKFHSSPTELHRRGDVPDVFCGDETVQETLLNMVEMPDGSAFLIEQHTRDEMISAATPPFAAEYGNSGELKSLTLPTGGQFKWRYAKHSDANARWGPSRVIKRLIFETPPLPNSTPTQEEEQATAIWQYRNDILDRRVTVRDPLGNETEHFYKTGNIGNSEPGWNSHWFKGLPFTADSWVNSSEGYKLYLSSISWDGEVDPRNPQNKLRSEYVRYEVNDPTLPSSQGGFPNPDQEKRRVASATVYHDDPTGENSFYRLESLNSEFDGFGNYRRNERWDSVSPSAVLSTITDYNRHLEEQDPKLINYWILNTFGHVQREYAGQISKTEYCFDTTNGFLLHSRVLNRFGTSHSINDLITVNRMGFSGGNATGNIAERELHGADLTPLSSMTIGQPICSDAMKALLNVSQPGHIEHYTYTNGVMTTTDVISPVTSEVILRIADNSIDANTGLISASQDPSGVQTSFIYDAQHRLISSSTPQLPTTVNTYCTITSTTSGCGNNNSFHQVTSSGSDITSNITNIYDGLNRKTKSQASSPTNASQFETLKTLSSYDALNRLEAETVTEVNPSFEDNRFTVFEYDALNRSTGIISPDGAVVTMNYTGARTATTQYETHTTDGDLPFSKTSIIDPVRNVLVSLLEPAGSGGAVTTTNYLYDVNKNLVQVNSGVQFRSSIYNNIGWLISSTDVETLLEASNTDFDVLGNPHHSTMGAARTLTTNYDHLGRVVSIFEELGAENRPIMESYYATTNSGEDKRAGKIVRVKRHNYIPLNPADPNSPLINHFVITERYKYIHPAGLMTRTDTSAVAYDANGIVHSRQDLLFEVAFGYNASGQLVSTRYPLAGKVGGPLTALNLTYHYNHGKQMAVEDATQPLISATYSRSLRSSISFINGHVQESKLDVSGMPRTGEITLKNALNTQIWSSGAFSYDGLSNISALGDNEFDYDGVGRLSRGLVGNLVQTAQYDQYGNITELITDGENAAISVDPLTNRLSEVAGTSYSYDAFGNITEWGERAISYDVLNMVNATDFNDRVRYFIYGPNNQRIGKLDNLTNEINWTVRGAAQKVLSEFNETNANLSWQRDYIYSSSSLIAARHPAGDDIEYRYFHLDHLNNTRLVSNPEGVTVAEYDYFPFGGFAVKSGLEADFETHLFTGHERDRNDELDVIDDLDYMLARYYSPYLGRFLSVDPVIGNAYAPQSWNRYAYVRNNPMNVVDTKGRQGIAVSKSPLEVLAESIHSATRLSDAKDPERAMRASTIAAGSDGKGVTSVAPSTGRSLSKVQQAVVPPGVEVVSGIREMNHPESKAKDGGKNVHAERVLQAKTNAVDVAASRPVCSDCAASLNSTNTNISTQVKGIAKKLGVVGKVITMGSVAGRASAGEHPVSLAIDFLPSAGSTSLSADDTTTPPSFQNECQSDAGREDSC